MNASEILMKALAAGATAALRPNQMYRPDFQKEISPAYLELKAMIKERYGQAVDVNLLNIGPGSPDRQEAVTQQLQTSGAADDEVVLQQAQKLLTIIAAENPESIWASNVTEPPDQLK